ncbi:MAG: TolC family protein [Verrucomicrobia bacterium]|nr:TolC family protein [Verrucomicrobiota bacterium]
MRLSFRLLSLIALAHTGCVQYQENRLSSEASFADFSKRSLVDAGLTRFLAENNAAEGAWSLERLSLVATYFHPDVALARAEAAEAAAGITTAEMRPNPVFTFMPQYASTRASEFTPWFLGPSLSVPIETAGKRSLRTDQALAAAEAARWRVSARAWAARSRVRIAMLELYGALENIQLLEVEHSLHELVISKLTAQMEAGEVSQLELTQARLMLNHTRLAMQDARRNADIGQARLAASVGLPLEVIRSLKFDFSAFRRVQDHGDVRRIALTRRADLLASLADYAAAESAVKLELARQYPDVNVMPGYDYNSGQNRWQLGLNVQLPLNLNRGPIAEAEARRTTAEKRFLALQATILAELDITLAAYRASRAKAATAAQLVKEADALSGKTRKLVEAGDVSALELTRRQIETSAAKINRMKADLEAQTAAGALEDAMQSPLP